jgi:ribose-phosphate pyrophosphokinase
VRSDKKDEPRISITARLVADLLETAGADRVLTIDLHSPQIQGFFSIPVDHLTAIPLLCEQVQGRMRGGDWVVVASDVGEAKDAGRYAKRLDLPLAFIDKRRYGDDEQPKAVHLVGEVANRDCLLVDDEVATGSTLLQAVEFLMAAGARSVSAAVVHPVLSGRAPELLRSSRLDRLVITDTIPVGSEKWDPRIEVVSVAPLLAEAIRRIHDGRSVSGLF